MVQMFLYQFLIGLVSPSRKTLCLTYCANTQKNKRRSYAPHDRKGVFAMISSRSGQSGGIFLPGWSPLVPAGLTKNSSGLLYLMGKLTAASGCVKRIIISSGKAIDSRERLAVRYNGEKVRDVYLPEWLLLDITLAFDKEDIPRTITLVCTSKKGSNDEFLSSKNVYIGRNRADRISWKDFSLLAGRFHLEELWHRITGVVKPSWGGMGSGTDGIYVADCNMHLGVIDDTWSFPLGSDMADLGRLEAFIQSSGVSVEERERPIEEIARTLRMLDCGADLWPGAVEKIIEEEQKREKQSGGVAIDGFGQR